MIVVAGAGRREARRHEPKSTLVGRIREDPTQENGLDLFVVGDNLRLGGAANALAIVRILTGERGS